MVPEKVHLHVLRELTDIIARSLLIIFGRPRQSREVPENCTKANVTSFFKKGEKEDPENCRPVSPTPIPVKVMEEAYLGGHL